MTVALSAPSRAFAVTEREQFEGKILACPPPVDQLIERAKQQRAEFIATLVGHFAARLKSLFRASAYPTAPVPSDA